MANAVKDFGLGTVKDFLGKGGKGALYGVAIAGAVALGPGLLVGAAITSAITGAAAAAGAGAILAGIVSGTAITGLVGFFTAVPIVGASASVGAAYGGITGGTREVKKSVAHEQDVRQAHAVGLDHQIQREQQKNVGLRNTISQEQKALKYQTENHLAANNTPNKFQSQFAAEGKNNAVAQGAGIGGK